ncbi:ABC transporter ATP-binding protein/permease [Mesorhizobium sp. CO1-1-7]|uniref:ABC-type multidrug transport system, ATPase and permease component n=1 Tax=Mesorhizobium australicum (strain HAMBI 3006 / LMG 24608 / WSM2073) TaxID=754035 RepID=L0KD47_MESAW|nr:MULTISPECIES: ABC transporter ATP-binding protein [Mesorhizobium]AGB43237.1 ABC-type multidrug transport system, ATPase and permease component [Mesorhizobium australicum WSM2073]MBZ9748943.1 ABC transporter ATP-binding protein/permease [Mesorhizobium sp. CO1-1-7]MBZ9975551.1 ABC transporter ATP-binding protein/permease [Mesorhizobium sp. BR-1-1-10]TPL80218.1 ABC transporter ATP-binding protein [Mesorhizobium sp. B2-3-14]
MTLQTPNKLKARPGEVTAVLRRILAENSHDYRWTYVMVITCSLIVSGTTAFTAWIMAPMVNQIFYERRGDAIVWICAGFMAAFLLRGFAGYGQAVALAKIGNNLVARYQKRIFDHLMKLGVGFFNDTRSGRLAAQVNENVGGIRDLLSLTLTSITRDAVTLLGLLGVMVYQDPVLSLSSLLIGPPLIWAVVYLTRRVRRITRESVLINSRLIGAVQEATQGIAIVKAFTMEDELSSRIGKLASDAEQRSNKIARVSERLSPISDMLAGFAVTSVIAYSGYRALVLGQPPGAVFSFITALILAYDPARRLARMQVGMERALVNARMIYELLDLEPKQGDAPGATKANFTTGEVRFNNVSFRYVEETPVLQDLSFVAAAGKMTAVIGASGAGKTTLVALLQRFYDVESGTIEIDGQDISKVTKQSLRGSIAYVSQAPYLFEGTIRDNIRYGRPSATDAEIEQAARLAAADEFIRQQPQGYDTPVGENGATLSGGQRQRVSIARAIVRQAPILLLDEATSALDNEAEARVQQALTKVMEGRTTIVIAHRLSTVVNADHIIVLEQGHLVEEGTHASLMADPHSVYARFHRIQGVKGLGLVDDSAPAETSVQELETQDIAGSTP